MTSKGLYTIIAAAAVVGGYALYRREKDKERVAGPGPEHVGWEHSYVDYQNPADCETDQRYERNFFVRPYQIFNPGGEIRPFEIDAHGQPTGRQVVMPGESPTVGNPADYIMVGFHPAGFGRGWGHHGYGLGLVEAEQAALAQAQADALAAQQLAVPAVAPAAAAAVTGFHPGHFGHFGWGGRGIWSAEQAALAAQAQAQADALAAQQGLAVDPTLAAAVTGEYATGALNPIALMRLRQMMARRQMMGGMGGMGGGGMQQQLLQQQLAQAQMQQQLLQQQLAQAQADALAAQTQQQQDLLTQQAATTAATAATPAV
jgi:hypothetical protein